MAVKKMWAWTDIRYHVTEGDNKVSRTLKCGNEAVQIKMGLKDAQWEELVTTKAVRPVPYPVPLNTTNPVSPVTHYRKIARAIEMGVDDPSLLESVLPPLQDNEPVKVDSTKLAAATQ